MNPGNKARTRIRPVSGNRKRYQIRASDWLPYGDALLDYWNGDADATIAIRYSDKSEIKLPVHIFFRQPWEQPEIERYAISMCEGRILEIGGGSGSHALELQESGMEVTVADISTGAVKLMKDRGVKNAVRIDIYRYTGQRFDAILMLMNGIGFVGDLKGLDRFLVHARKLIAPGGKMLLDSSDIKNRPGLRSILGKNYGGETTFRFQYGDRRSGLIRWLYIDEKTLGDHARKKGWHCQIVFHGEEGRYLAMLRLQT